MIAAIREFLVKVIAPLVWRFMYDNKDDFIRYARVVFRAKIGDLLHVAQKKIGLSPLASKIIKNAVLDFDEEIIIAGSGVKEFPRINTKAIHTIDQGMNVYTLYACVPTSLYLNWCRHTLSTPNWKEYIEILNHLEDIGVWVPGEGANTDRTAIAMEEYLNGKYPEKQVAIEKAYRMDKTLKEGWDK